ncbi:MAG: hypothetical protein LBE08_13645 [Bifidobacteriaceae bacterium]|jgi:hypothetical protein|nr:hypothetical protein [Bifidobacteriaceae bacterium]
MTTNATRKTGEDATGATPAYADVSLYLRPAEPWPLWGQAIGTTGELNHEAVAPALAALGLRLTAEAEQAETMAEVEATCGIVEGNPNARWLETLPEAQQTKGAMADLGVPEWAPPAWLARMGERATMVISIELPPRRESA